MKTRAPDQDDAHPPSKPTAFCRSAGGGHHTGHRSFDPQAKSENLVFRRKTAWGMSDDAPQCPKGPCHRTGPLSNTHSGTPNPTARTASYGTVRPPGLAPFCSNCCHDQVLKLIRSITLPSPFVSAILHVVAIPPAFKDPIKMVPRLVGESFKDVWFIPAPKTPVPFALAPTLTHIEMGMFATLRNI